MVEANWILIKNIESKVLSFIKKFNLIAASDKILVALSGGSDSVFLLQLLNNYKKYFKIDLAAMHINHQLRGKEAKRDEEFCKNFCHQLKVDFYSTSADVKSFAKKNKISIEEAGRKIRYASFKKFSAGNEISKIATAHNLNDNTETIFLNLIKGSGIKGLSGIPIKRENIIRPILCVSKDEIMSYLKLKKIKFIEDSSNKELVYQRNYLRKKIIPLIKKNLNPNLDNTFFNNALIHNDFLSSFEKLKQKLANDLIKIKENEVHLDFAKMIKLKFDNYFFGEVLKNVIEDFFNVNLSFRNISKILDVKNYIAGKTINISKNLFALKERDFILIAKKEKKITVDETLEAGVNLKLRDKNFSINRVKKQDILFSSNKFIEYVSGENLSSKFILRNWKDGDRFFPLGMSNSKLVSDFLTDNKISNKLRNEQLVLLNNDSIIWLVGHRIDNRFKIKNNSKIFYKLSFI